MQAFSGETERSQHKNKQIAMAMIEGGLTCATYRGPMPEEMP
jgi:protein subunit release factor A